MKHAYFARTWMVILAACLALPARAEWVRRVTDGIMGTRITVELWAEDKDKANQAIDAVLDSMRYIDETMSTYKPASEVSLVRVTVQASITAVKARPVSTATGRARMAHGLARRDDGTNSSR